MRRSICWNATACGCTTCSRAALRAGLEAAFAELRQLALNCLDQARTGIAALRPQAIPALLPLALVRPSLARAARADPFAPKEIAPWRRQWLMWRAARTGRLAG